MRVRAHEWALVSSRVYILGEVVDQIFLLLGLVSEGDFLA